MYDTAKKAREAMKSKARRLASEKTERVSSSDWTPAEPLNADVKTGARPISRRAFKKGGKVEGSCGAVRADRKPRKAGGKVESEKAEAKQYAIAKVNRDVKAANEQREGIKHVGGFKKGGRTKKEEGGSIESMIANMNKTEAKTALPKRGPEAPRRPVDVSPAASVPKETTRPPHPKYLPGDTVTGGSGSSGTSGRKSGGRTDASVKQAKTFGQKAKGRAKKMMGGPMMGGGMMGGPMMDPRMGMVKDKALDFGGQGITPGVSPMKKGGRAMKKRGGILREAAEDVAKDEVKNLIGTGIGMAKSAVGLKKGGKIARKEGGKVSHMEWEHSKKDLAEDKKLAKKHGMSLEQWEKSAADKKHDKQQSMKGLKRGGRADGGRTDDDNDADDKGKKYESWQMSGEYGPPESPAQRMVKAVNNYFTPKRMKQILQGVEDARENNPEFQEFKARRAKRKADENMKESGYADGGRTARKDGGRTKAKGKTNIAIVINAGQKPQQQGAGMPPMGAAGPDGMPIPVPPPAPAGGAPMPMPMPMPMPAAAPPMHGGAGPAPGGMPPMPRKAGGRVSKVAKSFADMEAGAGSGEGRLQKTDIAKRQAKPGFTKGRIDSDNKGYPNKVNGAVGGRTARATGGKAYRSYKDMDAGAGSGKGRLEKTEIEAHKR